MDMAGACCVCVPPPDVHFEGKLKQGASLDAATVSGDINVAPLPRGGYAYEASTFSGDITDCFDARSEKSGAGHSLSGTRGVAQGTSGSRP
jgi:hypothetical protein